MFISPFLFLFLCPSAGCSDLAALPAAPPKPSVRFLLVPMGLICTVLQPASPAATTSCSATQKCFLNKKKISTKFVEGEQRWKETYDFSSRLEEW